MLLDGFISKKRLQPYVKPLYLTLVLKSDVEILGIEISMALQARDLRYVGGG